MSLFDEIRFKPREEFLRLQSVELSVPTDEQLAKAADTLKRQGRDPIPPRAQVVIRWEPVSYVLVGGDHGNVTTDYMEVSFGLEPDELQRVRDLGWLGIPDNKVVRGNMKRAVEQQDRQWTRWMRRNRVDDATSVMHIDVDKDGSVTGKAGQLYSFDIGKVFRCEAGVDEFPKRERDSAGAWRTSKTDTNSLFMRYPLEDVTTTYVAPENPPQVILQRRDNATPAAAVSAVAARAQGGLTAEVLKSALSAAGIIGRSASTLRNTNAQIRVLDEGSTVAPALAHTELAQAAEDGVLLEYLASKGAIEIDDAGIIREKE